MTSRIFLALTAMFALLVQSASATVPSVDPDQLVSNPKQQLTTALVTRIFEQYHYKKVPIDDALSEAMLDRYLESLDYNRSIFLKSDIDGFAKYRTRLDDALRSAALDPAFELFRVFRVRAEERVSYARALLEKGFAFDVDEYFVPDRHELPWAASRSELDEIWRKRVKNDYLNLRLAGKPEADIKDTLSKRYERLLRTTEQMTAEDIYQLFINAYAQSVEPHTAYLLPRTSENFKINMSLSLEGIGAALRTVNDHTVVQQIITGGPADLSGQVHPEDRIVGVAQGEGDFVDVVGWRLQDVVDLIRGPKGSVVRLQTQAESAADGDVKAITLVRDKIKLEEQAAKKSIIESRDGDRVRRIGVIDVPTFYMDFDARTRGDKDFRSTTRDVRLLLSELKRENVDGVIVDLRGNGGGSLAEATSLTGLFIKSGPVVQIRDSSGRVQINEDDDAAIAYDGPLAVLVDRYSASASEIFAGAIQDYGRGLILGEPTYGKGTVQTLIDLDRYVQGSEKDFGQVKVTMAQFFRVSGDSTQRRGVVPDITFPIEAPDEEGERSIKNALAWGSIKPARFVPFSESSRTLVGLKARHQARIESDAGFRYLLEEGQRRLAITERNSVSLLESRRRAEQETQRKEQRVQEDRFRLARGLDPLGLEDEEVEDEASVKAREEVARIWLDEAAHILADYTTQQANQLPAGLRAAGAQR